MDVSAVNDTGTASRRLLLLVLNRRRSRKARRDGESPVAGRCAGSRHPSYTRHRKTAWVRGDEVLRIPPNRASCLHCFVSVGVLLKPPIGIKLSRDSFGSMCLPQPMRPRRSPRCASVYRLWPTACKPSSPPTPTGWHTPPD